MVLEECSKPGSKIISIANHYGISKQTLYKWIQLRSLNKTESDNTNNTKLQEENKSCNFVELAVEPPKSLELRSASLVFKEYSISIEGNIKTQSLLQIIHVLEGSC